MFGPLDLLYHPSCFNHISVTLDTWTLKKWNNFVGAMSNVYAHKWNYSERPLERSSVNNVLISDCVKSLVRDESDIV